MPNRGGARGLAGAVVSPHPTSSTTIHLNNYIKIGIIAQKNINFTYFFVKIS
jgi:hypothetical protein